MPTFLHMADIHLGYRQYQSDERLKDFSYAFERAIDSAIQKQVDFVLIAGDLFDKATIGPQTLLHAKRPLDSLRTHNIPAIAINGNHDRVRYGNQFSWLDYLEEDECLTVLKPTFRQGDIELIPINPTRPTNGTSGGYIDLHGVRVIGLPYVGASTASALQALTYKVPELPTDEVQFTVLMGHFGIEEEVPTINDGVCYAQIMPLKPAVDYLALGHVHKPIERKNWIYNPGSLESCGMDERRWRGGWFYVDVETGTGNYQANHVKGTRRPMHRWPFPVDEYDTPEALYDGVRDDLLRTKPMLVSRQRPVAELRLEGLLGFDRHDLDIRHIQTMLTEIIEPLVGRVSNHTVSDENEIVVDQRLDRTELERQVLLELFSRDKRYRDEAEQWAKLAQQVKSMVLAENDPTAIVARINEGTRDAR